MEPIIKGGTFEDSPIPVSLEHTFRIINQMKNSICKILNTDNIGTGYFCKLTYKSTKLPFLITNNHILNNKYIEHNKEIKLSMNDGEKNKYINIIINKERMIYTNEKLDVTLIEIKPNLDGIDLEKCLELDDGINEDEKTLNEIYKSIYILHYPKHQNISVSYGLISEINGREIKHLCNTENESAGSPILSLNNLKVIGIHIGTKKNDKYNLGTFMKYVLLEMNKKNEMEILYDNKDNEKSISIFGYEFVKNNKNNCKLIIDNKEVELCEKLNIENKKDIKIKLKEIKMITNMSSIFYECSSLSSLPEISNWDTSNITNMNCMFSGCSYLSSLPDISNWNTSNVTNMSFMFEGCLSLSSLPDISKWDISNVKNMNGMFYECSSLLSLPDISNWNTSNLTNMDDMFAKCSSLKSLPDISNWNTSKVINMSGIFSGCSSLSSLPNISNWNTANVTNMCSMFSGCTALSSLPNFSNWNVSNVTNMKRMFSGCTSLSSLPDFSNWNVSTATNTKRMFSRCKKSLIIPSKFNK